MTNPGERPPAGQTTLEPNSEIFAKPYREYHRLRGEGKSHEEAFLQATADLSSDDRETFERGYLPSDDFLIANDREAAVSELKSLLAGLAQETLTTEEREELEFDIGAVHTRTEAVRLRERLAALAGSAAAAPGAPSVKRIEDVVREMEALGARVQPVEVIVQGGRKQVQSIGLLPHADGRVEVLRIKSLGKGKGYEVLRKGEFYTLGDGQFVRVGRTSKFSLATNSGTYELVPEVATVAATAAPAAVAAPAVATAAPGATATAAPTAAGAAAVVTPAAAAAAPPAPAAPGVPPATLQALQQQLSQLQATLASLVAPAAPATPQQPVQGTAPAGATPVATPTPAAAPAAAGVVPPGGAAAAPPAPNAAPGGTPIQAPQQVRWMGQRRAAGGGGALAQVGLANGAWVVRAPNGSWTQYPNRQAATAAMNAIAQGTAPAATPPQPAAQPPTVQPVAGVPQPPVTPNAVPAAQQFLHQPLGSSPTPPAGYTPLPYANGGISLGQDGSGNFWVLHPSFGYYRYGTMQEAGAAMIYYAHMAPAHAAAAQVQAGPGGTLQQAVNAAPQPAQQATTRAMRSIRTILAQDRERLTGQHGRVLGFFRFLLRWEYGLTFAAGAGAGALVGALTAASGGLGVAGAAKLGAGVSLVRSAMEAQLARRILGEEAAREQAAGNTARANEVLQERDNLRLLSRENVMSTVLVNGLIGAAGGAFGNWFLNQTSVGQSIKSGIASAGKWILGIANTPPAPAGAAAAAAAAVNNVPPPGPGVNSGWAPTGNKLAAGATTVSKLPGRVPGASAATFVNDPRPSKVAYVPRGPQSMYVEPAPSAGTRIFVQPPGGPKGMYVLPPEVAASAPRLATVPYVIGGDESVWSFAQQEMQKGVLSRAANMLPSNLHDSFINAMHDTLDKTPKFKSLLLGMPDAANVQWNKIPNGTKVDFAALLSNQEFLDEFRKTATSLRYGSLWRALTQNGNTPERFFAVVRSLYVPAPTRAGGIIA